MRPPNRATSLHPPLPSFRHSHPSAIPASPLRHSCGGVGATGREMLGTAHSQHRFRSPHARPSQRLAPFPSFRHSCAPSVIPAAPSVRNPLRPPNRHSTAPPSAIPAPLHHSCAPSIIPAPPPSGIPRAPFVIPCDEPPSVIPAPPPSFLRPFRHSCAPSVIPAPLPPFLRPLRHSCGGRNPRDRPTVRRASICPSAHQSLPARRA